MNDTVQYTIRKVPESVDQYLRRRARISGKSLNQVIVDELSEKANLGKSDLIASLDWFIGSGSVGDDVLGALDEEDKIQKEITKNQWSTESANRDN